MTANPFAALPRYSLIDGNMTRATSGDYVPVSDLAALAAALDGVDERAWELARSDDPKFMLYHGEYVEALRDLLAQNAALRAERDGAYAMIEAQVLDHASNNIRLAETTHRAQASEATHVNEPSKSEHDAGNVLTDAALTARLREIQGQAGLFASTAADRIETLVKERDEAKRLMQARHREMLAADGLMRKHQRRAEQLEAALRVARVHVANNAEGWSVSRGASRDDLTIVDAALKGADHE